MIALQIKDVKHFMGRLLGTDLLDSFLLEEAGFEGRFHLRGIADPYIKHAPMFRSLETLGLNAESMGTLVRATLAQEKGGPHEETA